MGLFYQNNKQCDLKYNTSSRFWRFILPFFGQEYKEVLATTVSTLFDENSSNQFYIRISVVGIP